MSAPAAVWDGLSTFPSAISGYLGAVSASKGKPAPNGILPSLIGTRRIKVRRSFKGNDASRQKLSGCGTRFRPGVVFQPRGYGPAGGRNDAATGPTGGRSGSASQRTGPGPGSTKAATLRQGEVCGSEGL